MDIKFDTHGGQIHIERTAKTITPCGGLAAFSSFLSSLRIIELLVDSCPIQRSSNNATPIRDILVGFILMCVQEGKRFKHIRYVQHDRAIGKIFGIERRIPGDDTVRRFFASIDSEAGREWLYKAQEIIYRALNTEYILDWDSTVTTRYGEQEYVAIGYNPQKHGRGSHHPLVCSVAGLRLCLDMDFRPGDSSSSDGWIAMMERLLSHIPPDRWPSINRADVGFCSEKFLSWHEADVNRPRYLFKLRKTALVKGAISEVKEADWQGSASVAALQLAEARLKLHGWSNERRVVLGRRLISLESPDESQSLFGYSKYEYYAWVTNLSSQQFEAFQIADLYQKRADCENIFDELKNQWGFSGFCSHDKNVTELAGWLTLLSYNLWSLFVRFFSGRNHQEAITSRNDFLLLASQLVETGREKILKIAVNDKHWIRIKTGYGRLLAWVRSNAPLLGVNDGWLRAIANMQPPNMGLLTATQ
ncbi:hypothetical protein R80B4_00174 [Fibrobacteres bacterium R8-0-B4]